MCWWHLGWILRGIKKLYGVNWWSLKPIYQTSPPFSVSRKVVIVSIISGFAVFSSLFLHMQFLRNNMVVRQSSVCGYAVIHCSNQFELIYDTLHGNKLKANTCMWIVILILRLLFSSWEMLWSQERFLMYISFCLATLNNKPVLHHWLSGIYFI